MYALSYDFQIICSSGVESIDNLNSLIEIRAKRNKRNAENISKNKGRL